MIAAVGVVFDCLLKEIKVKSSWFYWTTFCLLTATNCRDLNTFSIRSQWCPDHLENRSYESFDRMNEREMWMSWAWNFNPRYWEAWVILLKETHSRNSNADSIMKPEADYSVHCHCSHYLSFVHSWVERRRKSVWWKAEENRCRFVSSAWLIHLNLAVDYLMGHAQWAFRARTFESVTLRPSAPTDHVDVNACQKPVVVVHWVESRHEQRVAQRLTSFSVHQAFCEI